CWILRLQSEIRARESHFREPRADRRLTSDKRSSACRAALLSIPVSEKHAFFGDAVDVRSAVSHDAVVVRADIEPADIVSPDDQNVRFLVCHNQSPLCWLVDNRGSHSRLLL